MYYHAKANGEITQTEEGIDSNINDGKILRSNSLVVFNCPDEKTALELLEAFKESVRSFRTK